MALKTPFLEFQTAKKSSLLLLVLRHMGNTPSRMWRVDSCQNPDAELWFQQRQKNELWYTLKSIIVKDKLYEFEPQEAIVPWLYFRPTISNPNRWTLEDVEVKYPQAAWLPMVPQNVRVVWNQNISKQAAKLETLLSNRFQRHETYLEFAPIE